MKKLAPALALALAISPLTFAQKILEDMPKNTRDISLTSVKKHNKGKHVKKSTKTGSHYKH